MPFKVRVYKCSNCDNQIDRDLNAAKNIANWTVDISYPTTCSLQGSNACGEVSKLDSTAIKTSLKQEEDFKPRQLSLFDLMSKFSSTFFKADTITSAQLVIGTAATNSSQRFIYNRTSGALLFDKDGNGSTAAVGFATLGSNLNLTFEDIFVG